MGFEDMDMGNSNSKRCGFFTTLLSCHCHKSSQVDTYPTPSCTAPDKRTNDIPAKILVRILFKTVPHPHLFFFRVEKDVRRGKLISSRLLPTTYILYDTVLKARENQTLAQNTVFGYGALS